MSELEERMNNNDWRGIIGDIFAKMTSASVNLLEMYTAYVNSFPKAISTLSKCTRSSGKFRKFLEVSLQLLWGKMEDLFAVSIFMDLIFTCSS